ncbi:MAG: hypothetical protein ACREEM_42475 [Blastocatellia bacterium]
MRVITLDHTDPGIALNSRRNFMLQSTAGLLGMTLYPASSLAASAVVQSGAFVKLLGRFAENMAFNLISNYVYDWLKTLHPQQQTIVGGENNKYLGRGYSLGGGVYGPSQPLRPILPVPQPPPPPPYFILPLQKRDGVNGLAHFFDFSQARDARAPQPNYWAGTLAAPSILGLNRATRELLETKEAQSAPEIRQSLLPLCGGQKSLSCGCFNDSYEDPDEYCTQTGKVWIRYTRTNLRGGRVRVAVTRFGKVVLDAEYCAEPA